MTSPVKPLLLLTLLILRGNGSTSDFDSSQTYYAGVVADEVPLEYHSGVALGGLPDWSGGDWSVLTGDAGGRLNQARCTDIPANMSLCRGIGYAQMRLPNLLDHDSVHEATQQAASWVPLLNIHCHEDTQMFLCSLFAPICLDRPIYPCRTLCQAVQAGCESRMRNYGFPWPEMLRCDKFPLDNDLCVGIQHHANERDDNMCAACSHPDTFESVIDNFCTAEFAIKIKSGRKTVSGPDIHLVAGKKSVFKKTGLTRADLRGRKTFHIDNGANCRCDALPSDDADGRDTDETLSDEQMRRDTGRYLVMGKKKQGRLIVTFVRSLDRQRSRQLSRAVRAMRRQATTICMRAGINAAFASASPPYRVKNRNESGRKKKDGENEKLAARSNNEMKSRRRRARKHRRRSSPATEIETETET